ncbi:hypothetical protein PTKU46_93790 [Paraburkholderia terrae]
MHRDVSAERTEHRCPCAFRPGVQTHHPPNAMIAMVSTTPSVIIDSPALIPPRTSKAAKRKTGAEHITSVSARDTYHGRDIGPKPYAISIIC